MNQDGADKGRRRFLTAAATVVGGVGAAFTAVPFLAYWKPSARAQAAGAPVEVDVSKLEYGQRVTTQWRGKPVWVVRRQEEVLKKLPSLNDTLRDPLSKVVSQTPPYCRNIPRAIKPEYLVVVAICTHLGCVPLYKPYPDDEDMGVPWFGGFFCPCHGSKYDLSGRVYQGVPAPMNLEVPPYRYAKDNVIVVGEDKGAA